MTFAHLSTPLLGIVNTAVIGRLGDAALLGAVAVGALVFDVVFWGFSFLRMGTTGLTAQAVGATDDLEVRAALARALLLAALCGVALIALRDVIAWAAFSLVGASPAVEAAARRYVAVRIWSAPFTLVNYAILGWFLGQARARTGLLLQLVLNGTNAVLNVSLVLWLDWGVPGVALGTVFGEATTAIVGGALAWRALGGRLAVPRTVLLDRARMVATLAVGRDIMIRSLALVFAFSFFTSQGARFGDLTLAANAVLQNLFLFASYFLDGVATAAEQICGEAVGARDRLGFGRAVRLTAMWAVLLAVGLSAALFGAGGVLIDVMTASPDVRAAARQFLPYAAATPLAGALAFEFDGLFIGATWGRAMRDLMLVSLAIYLAAWALLAPRLGNHGLWLALLVFLLARAGVQALALPRLTRRTFGAS